MNTLTNNHIRCTIALASLKQVMDPEIGLNVVDLGLIYQLNFDEERKRISVTMTLTTPYCPMGQSITTAVNRVLEHTFSGEEVLLELSFDPPWSPERISDEGKQFLNR